MNNTYTLPPLTNEELQLYRDNWLSTWRGAWEAGVIAEKQLLQLGVISEDQRKFRTQREYKRRLLRMSPK